MGFETKAAFVFGGASAEIRRPRFGRQWTVARSCQGADGNRTTVNAKSGRVLAVSQQCQDALPLLACDAGQTAVETAF